MTEACSHYADIAPPHAPEALNEVNVDKDQVELSWDYTNDKKSPAEHFISQSITIKDTPWETVAKISGTERYKTVVDPRRGSSSCLGRSLRRISFVGESTSFESLRATNMV